MDSHPSASRPEVAPPSPDPRTGEPNAVAAGYLALAARMRVAGLLRRRRGYYITVFTVLMMALAGAWTGFVLLGASWFQLFIAAGLGILFTQFSFLAHEAAHRQVFASKRVNE